MVLERNPNFRGEPYPSEGEPEDARRAARGRGQADALHRQGGLQPREGRHSRTGTSSCRAITTLRHQLGQLRPGGARLASRATPTLTPEMEEKGIRLQTSVATSDRATSPSTCSIRWSADGRASARASCARRSRSRSTGKSTSRIFANGRGIPAQGPIPPGIFGYREGREGINPVVYDWVDGKPRAQADRGRAEAARRGRLSRRPRREDRAAAGALLRHRRARPGRQGAARLVPARSSRSSASSS